MLNKLPSCEASIKRYKLNINSANVFRWSLIKCNMTTLDRKTSFKKAWICETSLRKTSLYGASRRRPCWHPYPMDKTFKIMNLTINLFFISSSRWCHRLIFSADQLHSVTTIEILVYTERECLAVLLLLSLAVL